MGRVGDHGRRVEVEEDLDRHEHQQQKHQKPGRRPEDAGPAFRSPGRTVGHEPMLFTSVSMFCPAAAERLGITALTLYRFIDEGQVPAYKFGRVIRLKQSDVDAYIESCRVEPGSMSHLYPETQGSGD